MDFLFSLLIAYFILSLGYALFSLRTTRSALFRVVAVLYLACSIALSLFLYNQLLSRPKPISQEFLSKAKEAVVLAARVKPDEAIYLWLELPGRDQPAYYSLPWIDRVAQDLEGAKKQVEEHGGLILMKDPFAQTLRAGLKADKDEQVFYASPPPRPPPKQGEDSPNGTAYRYAP
jgi:hypothetical protein